MFRPALVVVDMQKHFEAANRPEVVSSVTREIIKSMQNSENIVYLEYFGCGPTHFYLKRLTKDYCRTGFVKKRDDDGSRDLVCFFEKMNSLPLYVKVCGVNADCCVHVTVAGLIRLLPSSKIEIIKDACGWSLDYHKDHRAWKSYGKHPNLNFV